MPAVFVPIKDATIRKNPDAGRQDYHVPTGSTITLTVAHDRMLYLPVDRFQMTERRTHSGLPFIEMTFLVRDADALNWFRNYANELKIKKDHWSYSIDNHLQHVHSMTPEPEYTFSYADPDVRCHECGKTFPLSQVREEQYSDEGSWDACPRCVAPLTLQVERETIRDALFRIANQEAGS